MSKIEDMINEFEKRVKEETGYDLMGIALHNPSTDRVQVNWNDDPEVSKFEALNSVALMWVAMADGKKGALQTSLEYASHSYGCDPALKLEDAKGLLQAFAEASIEVMREQVQEAVERAQNRPQDADTEYIVLEEDEDDDRA